MDEQSFKAELRELHDRLGFALGWDFAVTPMAYLAKAETIMVGLNPGGKCRAESWESDEGNAYFTGRWQVDEGSAPTVVQSQVRALHKAIDMNQDAVFAAQFFPFRSENWKDIPWRQKEPGLIFSKKLWKWIVDQSTAKRFICMGAEATDRILDLLNINPQEPETYATGWGKIQIKRYVASDGRVVVNWPHPSWYRIFTREDPAKSELAKASMIAAARFS